MKKMFALFLCLMMLAPAFAMAAEEVVMIEGSHHQIPATITLPEGEGPFPFVVMYHGTGSDRHEAGGGYDLLAPKLAEAGIASARFDFAGSGDSPVDYVEYSLTGGMEDGVDVIEYMRGLDQVDNDRLGVLGWSQGGTVAMLTAARVPGIRSLVTWAGAVDMSFYAADQYDEAKANGFAVVAFDWRPSLNFSIDWFDEVRNINITEEMKAYDGAILALAGAKDDVVPPDTMDPILENAPTEVKRKVIINDADHTFNIFSGDMTAFDELIDRTVEWFGSTL